MRRLAVWVATLAVAAGGISPAPVAAAQTDDDWEFAEDAALELTIAAARYDAGVSVIAQCSRNKLTVSLVGMPATTAPSRRLDATRSDGAVDTQTWEVRENPVEQPPGPGWQVPPGRWRTSASLRRRTDPFHLRHI